MNNHILMIYSSIMIYYYNIHIKDFLHISIMIPSCRCQREQWMN